MRSLGLGDRRLLAFTVAEGELEQKIDDAGQQGYEIEFVRDNKYPRSVYGIPVPALIATEDVLREHRWVVFYTLGPDWERKHLEPKED